MSRKLRAKEAVPEMNRGLGVAADLNIERALEIARDAHDAKAMRELRANLDRIMDQPDARVLRREDVLALLRMISEGLGPPTQIPIGETTTGETLVTDHPAIALLDSFVDAVSDLDRGKTDPSLNRCSYGPNASLTTQQRKSDDALLIAVEAIRNSKGLATLREAEEHLAARLKVSGRERRGKPYSAKMLKRLRDDRDKRK